MNHSPGPFSKGQLRSCDLEILDARGIHIATVHCPIGEPRGADPCDVQEANAALLIAAPDMLVACRAALLLLEGVAIEEERKGKRNAALNVRTVERSLSAAITKAGGGA